MMTHKEKVLYHQNLCEKLNEIYEFKDKRYNYSFAKTLNEYGPIALMLRLDDKLSRAKALLKDPGMNPGDETVVDTLIDLANYAIMGIIEFTQTNPILEQPLEEEEEIEEEDEDEDTEEIEEDSVDLHQNLTEELSEYTKEELVTLATDYLSLVKVNRKISKEEIIKIIFSCPDEMVMEAMDNFEGDQEDDEETKEKT